MNSKCRVCLEFVCKNETQIPFATPCGHLFHENCIKNCLENISNGKCPQCKQTVDSSALIRLFLDETGENSTEANEIEHLKSEIDQLKDKSLIQCDLIESLKRQLQLEKKFNQKEKVGLPIHSEPATLSSTFQSSNAPKRPKFNDQKFIESPEKSNVQASFQNGKDVAGQSIFAYGDKNSTASVHTFGASALNTPVPLKPTSIFSSNFRLSGNAFSTPVPLKPTSIFSSNFRLSENAFSTPAPLKPTSIFAIDSNPSSGSNISKNASDPTLNRSFETSEAAKLHSTISSTGIKNISAKVCTSQPNTFANDAFDSSPGMVENPERKTDDGAKTTKNEQNDEGANVATSDSVVIVTVEKENSQS